MLRSTAAQTAIAKALSTALPRAAVYRDGTTGVGISASVEQCKQAIQQALAALGATAVGWGTLHTATGSEDSEVTFTYNAQQHYIVTCYS
jgi:hypothetical protein